MKKNLWKVILITILFMQVFLKPAFTQNISLGNVEASPGQQVHIPMNFSNLNNVGAITMFIEFNENVLSFSQLSNAIPELQGVIANVMSSPTRIAISWFAFTGGVNFPNGKVVDLSFTCAGGETGLVFSSNCEIVDWDLNIITVTYINGSISPLQGEPVSIWTGDGFWSESSNWSNGVPGAETKAIVSSGNCIVKSGAMALKLIINTGTTVQILPNSSLTVMDSLLVDGNFTIVSDQTGTGSFIGNGESIINGESDIQLFISGGPDHDHLISSPVQQSTTATFNSASLFSFDESNTAWIAMQSGDILQNGQGYRITSPSNNTFHFTGQLTKSEIIVDNLFYLISGSSEWPVGFNAVGNPYTSAIGWNSGDWGKSEIASSVYAWNGSQYIAWNGTLGPLTNGVIPAMQGFFINALSENAELIIPLNSRIHDTLDYYKSMEDVDNLLVLEAEGNGYSDQFFIHFDPVSTDNFDAISDAFKLPGIEVAPQLFSTTTANENLSIDVQPSKAYTNIPVHLGFKVGIAGTYSISSSLIQNFSADIPIYLKDLKTNETLNFRTDTTYVFQANPSDNTTRFLLYFSLPPIGIEEQNEIPFNVISHPAHVVIDFGGSIESGNAAIYDLAGAEVHSLSINQQTSVVINHHLKSGVYMLRFTSKSVAVTAKFMIP